MKLKKVKKAVKSLQGFRNREYNLLNGDESDTSPYKQAYRKRLNMKMIEWACLLSD